HIFDVSPCKVDGKSHIIELGDDLASLVILRAIPNNRGRRAKEKSECFSLAHPVNGDTRCFFPRDKLACGQYHMATSARQEIESFEVVNIIEQEQPSGSLLEPVASQDDCCLVLLTVDAQIDGELAERPQCRRLAISFQPEDIVVICAMKIAVAEHKLSLSH